MSADASLPDDVRVAKAATSADERSLGWATQVILVIAALLALFSAASMRSWAETLSPTPTHGAIRQLAEGWSDLTDRAGLSAPRAGLRQLWTQARGLRFEGPPDAPPQR